jgi:hypothetical protein
MKRHGDDRPVMGRPRSIIASKHRWIEIGVHTQRAANECAESPDHEIDPGPWCHADAALRSCAAPAGLWPAPRPRSLCVLRMLWPARRLARKRLRTPLLARSVCASSSECWDETLNCITVPAQRPVDARRPLPVVPPLCSPHRIAHTTGLVNTLARNQSEHCCSCGTSLRNERAGDIARAEHAELTRYAVC